MSFAKYDAFEHLCRSLFVVENDLMAMLTVYGDASGSGPDRPVIVVGGFISTVQQWSLFNEQWGKVLAKGPVEVYHATDLEADPPQGEFRGWKEPRVQKFRTLAYQTLAPFVAAGISSGLVKSDFEDLKIRWHKIPQGKPGNHYYFCVQDFIVNVNAWAEAHGYTSNPINYVLERGDPGKGEVEQAFLELSEDPDFDQRHLIGSVSFLPKRCQKDPEKHKRLRPLQAADIWAYESSKLLTERALPIDSGRSPRKAVRPGMAFLFKKEWYPYNRYWNKENLPHFKKLAQKLGMPGLGESRNKR